MNDGILPFSCPPLSPLWQIIDPWGAVIAQCSRGEGICVAEIDTDLIEAVRSQMPVQQHRRRDVYELLAK